MNITSQQFEEILSSVIDEKMEKFGERFDGRLTIFKDDILSGQDKIIKRLETLEQEYVAGNDWIRKHETTHQGLDKRIIHLEEGVAL